jgi:hypothetical protein
VKWSIPSRLSCRPATLAVKGALDGETVEQGGGRHAEFVGGDGSPIKQAIRCQLAGQSGDPLEGRAQEVRDHAGSAPLETPAWAATSSSVAPW